MKKALAILFTAILIAGTSLAGAGCAATNDPKNTKVGFIYIGPIGDGGFTYAQDQGRLYLEKTLGVTTHCVENVLEDDKATFDSQVENLIKNKGCKVIFATSFGYGPYVDELAKKYPNIVFQHCSGDFKNDTNFGNYFGRMYQARYLTGIAAGKATKTGKIGYVAAYPIPEVIRAIDAFTLGVRSVNPEATVNVVWTSTWFDPVKEKQAAESLIETGCDVTAQHQDTPSAVAAAAEKGVFSTGYNSSMASSGKDGYLTSPVWNWGPYFVEVVKAVMNNTFKPQAYWGGIKDGIVAVDQSFGPSVTKETKDLIKQTEDKMKAGTWDVFQGTIKMQDGSEMSDLTDQQIWTLNKFVEGVVGEIPE